MKYFVLSIKREFETNITSSYFNAFRLSTYTVSTLYTTMPQKRIKNNLLGLAGKTLKENSLYFACNEKQAFYTSEDLNISTLLSYQKVYEALSSLLDNILIGFVLKYSYKLLIWVQTVLPNP